VNTPPAHPALRVPVPGDGAGEGAWEQVRCTPDGTPLLVADPEASLAAAGEAATAPFDALPFPAMRGLAHYLPGVVDGDAPLRVAVRQALARHAPGGARLAVEAGCSVGPDLRALRAVAEAVVGFDARVEAARVARALLRGEAVPLPERREGRSFRIEGHITLPREEGITVVVGDALDPPLRAEVADIVLAVNLIDTVPAPLTLLGQLDAILAPGGLLILTSPFAWRDDITAPERQLGGGTVPALVEMGSEAALRAILRGETPWLRHLAYEELETWDVPWALRDHARARFTYDVHGLVARKLG